MKGRKGTAEEKLAIVLEGIKGAKPVAEICREHGIAQTQSYQWWDRFLEGGKRAVTNGLPATAEALTAEPSCPAITPAGHDCGVLRDIVRCSDTSSCLPGLIPTGTGGLTMIGSRSPSARDWSLPRIRAWASQPQALRAPAIVAARQRNRGSRSDRI